MPHAAEPHKTRIPPIALVFLVIAALYFAREVLIPLAVAVLLAFLLTPAVRRLESWRLGRVPAVVVVTALGLALVGGLGWTVMAQLVEAITQLPGYRANIQKKAESFRGPSGGALARATRSVEELNKELTTSPPQETAAARRPPAAIQRPVPVELVEPLPNALQSARNVISPILAPAGTAGIVLVFTIVILIRREDLRNRLLRLIGVGQLTLVTKGLEDAGTRVSSYLRMQFLVNAAFAGLLTAVLSLIGLPTPLLWGVLAGLARFVPYVGPLVGGSLPFCVALAVFPGWQQPLLTLGLFIVIELSVAYVVEPWLYGAHTGVSSLAILVSAAFWTAIWGPIGLVVSTPLTACLVVLGRHVPRLEFLHVILGDDPALPAPAQLYQRLLALDRQEAQAVVDRFAAEMTPAELYDSVIIPALTLAEEDRHRGVLEEAHENFVAQIVVEFIEKLTRFREVDAPLADTVASAEPDLPGAITRTICIPGGDKADELAGAMLAQALQAIDVPAICLTFQQPNSETFQHLSLVPGDVVCISALPPFALLSARTLSKRLREQYPHLSIIVGLWGTTEQVDYMDRLRKAFGVEVVTSLNQAVGAVARIRDAYCSNRLSAAEDPRGIWGGRFDDGRESVGEA
jgi:predicted PurR-regulated permease PerM